MFSNRSQTRKQQRVARPSFRPQLEVLEARLTPSTFSVNSTGDAGKGSGLSGDLRYCITQADKNGGTNTIQFDPTVFGMPQTITLSKALPAITDNNLAITGPGSSLATLSGKNAYQVFNITAANASLSGLTIANGGNTSVDGGGISFNGTGTLAISNMVLANNSANRGGGVYCGGSGNLSVANSVLANNYAKNGGGAISDGTGNTTLSNCTLSGNTTTGGAFGGDGTDGGAIVNAGTLTATNSTFSGNFAYHYGGAIKQFGTATLIDCTLSGNSASGAPSYSGVGGALFVGGTTTLTNCTVAGNSAKLGGGITGGTPVTLNNTLIAGNTTINGGPDVNGTVTSGSGYNLIGNGSGMSGITNGTNGNQVGSSSNPINPLLAALGNYGGLTQTLALLPGSPALDAGSNSLDGGVTTDQRGDPRIVNGTVDIGAFESQGFTVTITGGNNQSAAVNTAFAAPLAVTVTSNAGEPVAGGWSRSLRPPRAPARCSRQPRLRSTPAARLA